jgi:enamine deaminase RidA (YjgF/YER057c/UK114 family)
MQFKIPCFAFALLLYCCSNAQEKIHLNPDGVNKPATYSQAVVVKKGSLIFTAGIVAHDTAGNIIGKGDLALQTKQVFENIQVVLAAAGASFKDVVKVNYYVVNYTPDKVQLIRQIRSNYLLPNYKPASTLVGVQALYHPDVMIEVEVIALVNKKKKKAMAEQ